MKQSQRWPDEEIDAAVEAYVAMLQAEGAGAPYVKADVNRALREGPLKDRSKASVEYRMESISAVLVDLGLARIRGYVPATNVGRRTHDRIRYSLGRCGHLTAESYEPTSDPDELNRRAKSVLKRGFNGPPRGNRDPKRTKTGKHDVQRDPAVRAWILTNAAGVCESCRKDAPFRDAAGDPFLEVHHMIPLAGDGPDIVENAVALCPNCHRRVHHSADSQAATDDLYESVERLSKPSSFPQ